MKRRLFSNPNGERVVFFLRWFWYFLLYSFLGFLLEVAFARATHGRPERKCFLLLPLCPVYGLGACAILLLPEAIRSHPVLLFLFGGLTATAAEYLTALFYERILRVSFWDYRGLPGNIDGRVCLPFSLIWGALSLPLVFWLHPAIRSFPAAIPFPVTLTVAVLLAADCVVSAAMLYATGSPACLNWHGSKEK